MTINIGEVLPNYTLSRFGTKGLENVQLHDFIGNNKVILFGVPGAYSRTCSSKHLPSFIKTMEDFKEKGVEKVICIAVNDPFVMASWDNDTGASKAGIDMLCDPSSALIKKIGLNFDAEPIGFFDRSKRFAMIINNKKVELLNIDHDSGICDLSAGETILSFL
jgi:peroxiredoxin